MKFVDCHTHPCFDHLEFKLLAKANKIRFDLEGLVGEAKRSNIQKSVAIGVDVQSNESIKKMALDSGRIIPVLGVEKTKLPFYLKLARGTLRDRTYSGIKIFLGYDDYFPTSRLLEPFYRLAEKYDVPVIFHTGDMWSGLEQRNVASASRKQAIKSRIKYSHPLAIDDVAIEHPDMKILMAHAGNPWTDDVAELIYRNDNCYADISGWFINEMDKAYRELMQSKLRSLVAFAGPEKLMFGTDWPLIRIDLYTKFLVDTFKGRILEFVSHRNAEKFWKIKT